RPAPPRPGRTRSRGRCRAAARRGTGHPGGAPAAGRPGERSRRRARATSRPGPRTADRGGRRRGGPGAARPPWASWRRTVGRDQNDDGATVLRPMTPTFTHVLAPGRIGPLELANRIVLPAMDMNHCDDGVITDPEIAH